MILTLAAYSRVDRRYVEARHVFDDMLVEELPFVPQRVGASSRIARDIALDRPRRTVRDRFSRLIA